MRPWSLTTALAVVEPEIWSAAPYASVGLVLPDADGRVRFEIRTPLAASANTLRPSDLPPALCDPPSPNGSVGHVVPGANLDRAADRLLSIRAVDTVVRVPLTGPERQATLWAGFADSRDAGDAEIRALQAIADRVTALAEGQEPPDIRERRLQRYDALSSVLPTLADALDLRDVFGRLSALARPVLAHDSSIVGILEDDGRQIRPYALSMPDGWTMPPVVVSPYPAALHSDWEFALHHDLSSNPLERDWPMARLGMRSSMRLPIHLNGRIAGVLTFNAFARGAYTQADVLVARRVGDYITLALSHQRIADDARDAAAVRERATQLEVVEGLLRTLTGVLDVGEVFDRVSQVSGKAISHDAMSITQPGAAIDSLTVRVATGALSHLKTPFDMPVPARRLLERSWEFELVDDLAVHPEFAGTPSATAGLASMLSLPVMVEGRFGAAVNFFSRSKGHFTRDDVAVGRRIADHIALALTHQRLVAEAQRTIELRARTDNLELLDQVLATLVDVANVAEVFERVSAAAKRVLPHDSLALPVLEPDGISARVYARTGVQQDAFSGVYPVPSGYVGNDLWEYDIVDDLQRDPTGRNAAAAQLGFRSALRVPIRFEGHFAASLVFLAYAPSQYSAHDVPVARRIADRVALMLARDRGVRAAQQADEASARAARLEERVRALTDELDARGGYRRIVGRSAAWTRVLTQAAQVASTEATVLLLGESGTGKEIIARFLHRASSRTDGRFVALNCAALPEQLLEAELFGYERGAFTGATQSKPGQLEQAAGGTLFLDEVGEMSLPAQAKFLRVLQEKEFQRLGGTRVLKTDARIVAATNRDLHQAIARGGFREDLFYRLNVFAIQLPALRERPDDVLPLAEEFLAEYARSLGRPPAGISRDARDRLREYHWPGNVRELRNILERAAILCEGGLITTDHLALAAAPRAVVAAPVAAQPTPPHPFPSGDLPAMERALVEQALQQARFNKSKAAKALGITRAQLYVRMKRYGLA